MTAPALPFTLKPVPPAARLVDDAWYTWGGSVTCTDDGRFHMLVARWPRHLGMDAWVTHSEIAHAEADHPLGPFTVTDTVLGRRDTGRWDAHVYHNPNVLRVDDTYYLYYMANRGDGSFWSHRNNQRIGVASAGHPAGPWRPSEEPVIDVTPNAWDALMTSNPAACLQPDGRVRVMYKAVSQGPMPFGGTVRHGVATADSPLGPFTKHPDPVLDHPTAKFAAEDPYIWHDGSRLRCLVKDQGGHYTGFPTRALCLFESTDGLDWRLGNPALLCGLDVALTDGRVEHFNYLERPQLYIDEQGPAVLYCGARADDSHSMNIHIPLRDDILESYPDA